MKATDCARAAGLHRAARHKARHAAATCRRDLCRVRGFSIMASVFAAVASRMVLRVVIGKSPLEARQSIKPNFQLCQPGSGAVGGIERRSNHKDAMRARRLMSHRSVVAGGT